MQYERVRFVLHKATLEWLKHGTVEGQRFAELQSDKDGNNNRRLRQRRHHAWMPWPKPSRATPCW